MEGLANAPAPEPLVRSPAMVGPPFDSVGTLLHATPRDLVLVLLPYTRHPPVNTTLFNTYDSLFGARHYVYSWIGR